VFVELLTECLSGWYSYVHFGLPCSWWSSLASLNGGSRRVTIPDGVRPFTKAEHSSFLQLERTCTLCLALHWAGSLFSIENPRASHAFAASPYCALESIVPIFEARFDQCQYGLQPPAAGRGEFVKKATKIVANFPVGQLSVKCSNTGHVHVHAKGRRRVWIEGSCTSVSLARAAGAYPPALCRALAAAAALAARTRTSSASW